MHAKHSDRSNSYQLEKKGIKYTLVHFTRKNQPKALQAEGRKFSNLFQPYMTLGYPESNWRTRFSQVEVFDIGR